MKNYIQAGFCLLAYLLLILPVKAETIPIPKKRPDVMNVSPAYIEQLRNRDNPKEENYEEEEEANVVLPPAYYDESFDEENFIDNEDDLNNIEELDSSMVLIALETNVSTEDIFELSIPTPAIKPEIPEKYRKLDNKKTLVSFVLKPDQIALDSNLEIFLMEYAVGMFKDNSDLKMEIHSYATPEDNQDYSDVRRSLARALEVRSFLLAQNISPSRLKLTPMGQDKNNKTDNRIDLLFIATN